MSYEKERYEYRKRNLLFWIGIITFVPVLYFIGALGRLLNIDQVYRFGWSCLVHSGCNHKYLSTHLEVPSLSKALLLQVVVWKCLHYQVRALRAAAARIAIASTRRVVPSWPICR